MCQIVWQKWGHTRSTTFVRWLLEWWFNELSRPRPRTEVTTSSFSCLFPVATRRATPVYTQHTVGSAVLERPLRLLHSWTQQHKPATNDILKNCEIDWFVVMPATVWPILSIKPMQWPETEIAQNHQKCDLKNSEIDWFVVMPAAVWQILSIKAMQWPETEIAQNRQKWDLNNSWNWLVCGYACNSLTNFEYKAHTTTGNGDSTKPTKMRF